MLIQALSVFSMVLEKETIAITACYHVFHNKTIRNRLVCRMGSLILKNIATRKHSVYWSCLSIFLSHRSLFLRITSNGAEKESETFIVTLRPNPVQKKRYCQKVFLLLFWLEPFYVLKSRFLIAVFILKLSSLQQVHSTSKLIFSQQDQWVFSLPLTPTTVMFNPVV